MISQTFLDLTLMLLKERWDLNYDPVEVRCTMESYFNKEYGLKEVEEAIGLVVEEQLSNVEPNEFIK